MSTRNPSTELTQARLKELLHYDPDTGIFTRLASGCEAGLHDRDGYLKINVASRYYQAHRLAFLYMTGCFPEDQVDHIDGVRDDNRWVNLRSATSQENQHNNGGARKNSRSGLVGAAWSSKKKLWRGVIMLARKQHHLGYHATPELAHAAYLKAKDELHPTHRRLRGTV